MSLKIIWSLFKKEAELVLNDYSILLVLLAAPLLYFLLIGSTYVNKDEENVSVGIVDLDQTRSSKAFLNKINTTQKVAITKSYTNLSEARSGLYKFDVQGIITIPSGFEKKLKKNESSPIGLILNNTKFLSSNDINKTVNLVSLDYALESRQKFFESKGINPSFAEQKANPITAQIHAVYNPTNNYGNFLLPALLFLILHQTLLIGLAESIASDREKGLMQVGFEESKNNFLNYILGKTGFYLLLYFAYLLLTYLVVYPFFDLPVKGNFFILIIVSLIFFSATIVYGWFISSFFKSQTRAMEIIAFTSYPVFLVTGITWSVSEMPLFLQFISNLIPLKPFFIFLKKLAIMGVESHLYLNEIIHLLVLLLIGYIAAFLRFRYLQKQMLKIKPSRLTPLNLNQSNTGKSL
ncbi:ABC-type transporter, permease component [Psychroflexus torquis ATCC 700755]|uniref:ABC-type transporter, permease component n=1 Tax=Psychroflexus torquis (strain ATCC 700755 / CIP 106069 / ACAM 623) TaxID=313595 RepID=K4IFU5_PSYTT|nr:ABC transporter permease [Psychroflexus torquis]AFU69402.1 ABC-type transporter, permease component [Psychroflexus torquis ATCC 700755]